ADARRSRCDTDSQADDLRPLLRAWTTYRLASRSLLGRSVASGSFHTNSVDTGARRRHPGAVGAEPASAPAGAWKSICVGPGRPLRTRVHIATHIVVRFEPAAFRTKLDGCDGGRPSRHQHYRCARDVSTLAGVERSGDWSHSENADRARALHSSKS